MTVRVNDLFGFYEPQLVLRGGRGQLRFLAAGLDEQVLHLRGGSSNLLIDVVIKLDGTMPEADVKAMAGLQNSAGELHEGWGIRLSNDG